MSRPIPIGPSEDRGTGKHIVTLMTYLPVEDIRRVWAGMGKSERLRLFGNGHADELDQLVKGLGTHGKMGHLDGDEFGEKLKALHSGTGMDDHRAARVLHTASGVRMATRAAAGPGKNNVNPVAHETTMKILNARYKEKE